MNSLLFPSNIPRKHIFSLLTVIIINITYFLLQNKSLINQVIKYYKVKKYDAI